MNKRTGTLLVLWRLATLAGIALAASAVTLMVTGFGVAGIEPLMPWFLLALVASIAFRYAFFRSLQRDQDTLPREDSRME